jgi:hypothetical protein
MRAKSRETPKKRARMPDSARAVTMPYFTTPYFLARRASTSLINLAANCFASGQPVSRIH